MTPTLFCFSLLSLASVSANTRTVGPSGDGASPGWVTTNWGSAVEEWATEGDYAAFFVDESNLGSDLNGDGDSDDPVIHVLDLVTGDLTNLGLAGSISDPAIEIVGGRVIFTVFEFLQGMTDLNGDGNAVDIVLYIYDIESETLTNTGLATLLSRFDAGTDVIATEVREVDQGFSDLNGDGDMNDAVMFAVDPATGQSVNTQIAVSPFGMQVDGDLIAFTSRESEQGSQDLNGDFDSADTVLFVYRAGVTTNLGLAVNVGDLVVADGYAAFMVDEDAQNFADLNGDSDISDNVLHVYDASQDATFNSAYAVDQGSNVEDGFVISDGRIAFRVSELRHFGRDYNGDGDASDSVVHVMDLPLADPTNLGYTAYEMRMGGNTVVARVSEAAQGATDLNDDGDTIDRVLVAFDLVTGEDKSLGLHVRFDGDSYHLSGALVACEVRESGQGPSDLNGDGDQDDTVLFVYDLSTDEARNIGYSVSRTAFEGGQVLFSIFEPTNQTDNNGDGDMDDRVLALYHFGTDTVETLGALPLQSPFRASGPRVVYAVSEADEGASDLSGDLDSNDLVLHSTQRLNGYGLDVNGTTISLQSGGAVEFELDTGNHYAGDFYWLLGSISGTTPGLPGAPPIPLNPDAYFSITLQTPEAFISSALGFLNDGGSANAEFSLPPASFPGLAGLQLHHAAIVFDVGTSSLAWSSNAQPLNLAP